jgi:hypothetical protein
LLGFDISAALSIISELTIAHPGLDFLRLAIHFTLGCGILLYILCRIDLMLVRHVTARRRVLAGLPKLPTGRRLLSFRALRLLIRLAGARRHAAGLSGPRPGSVSV